MTTYELTAPELRQKIYEALGAAGASELALAQSWMRLGELLARFKAQESWRELGYGSFPEFMAELGERYQRGKTQLWSYLTVAEKLLPTIDAATLEEIGISKALELKKALVKSGKPLPPEVIEAAKLSTTTIKELRATLGQVLNCPDNTEKGAWFDFDGCFMTAEERKEFIEVVKLTITLLGISPDIPEHIRRKEIFFAWLREFRGTHEAEVYGPTIEATPATLIMDKIAEAERNEQD